MGKVTMKQFRHSLLLRQHRFMRHYAMPSNQRNNHANRQYHAALKEPFQDWAS